MPPPQPPPMMDESELIIEFMKISKCDRADAISCLRAWGYDLKKALIDYRGKAPAQSRSRSLTHVVPFDLYRHINSKLFQDQNES